MLVLKISRQDIFGKKVFESNEKYYFEDWGLRNSLTGYNVADTGNILENMVLLHLLILGFRVRLGVSGETEIDFVCTRNDKTIYVQVAYLVADEETVEREFGYLLRIKDNYPKYVVSMDEVTGSNYKGIEHLNVREFLKKDR